MASHRPNWTQYFFLIRLRDTLEKYQCENCDKHAQNHMITQSKSRVLCMQRSRIFPFQ